MSVSPARRSGGLPLGKGKIRMTAPIIFVAGLARCGTSAVMQMLEAAGIPMTGEYPSFEDDHMNHRTPEREWLEAHAGHAIKWLDPHVALVPSDIPGVVIWLDRDVKQQVESQVKLIRMLTNAPVSRDHRRRWATGLERDRLLAFKAIGSRPSCIVEFEVLIDSPSRTAERIANFLELHIGRRLDDKVMASVILIRSTFCQSGLDIEMRLIEERLMQQRKTGGSN